MQEDDLKSNPYKQPETTAESENTLSMFSSIVATLFSVVVGGGITIAIAVVLLEALHTKNGMITLLVFGSAIAVGSSTAIVMRRSTMQSRRKSRDC